MTFVAPGDEAMALAESIKAVVNYCSTNAPRSLQKTIGLSEVGEPCTRKIAYRLLDWEKTNRNSDPWASISGTAIHTWLADAFGAYPDKYLVEHKVQVSDQLAGTSDLFDIEKGMVIDHKCVGQTSMKSRKRDGMTHTQRVQINLYGLGMEKQGYTVNKVALAFYPLGGRLDGLYTIVEPYNRQLALDSIERIELTQALVWQLDPEENPQAWELIPATPNYGCIYCPWYLPGSADASRGCKGAEDAE